MLMNLRTTRAAAIALAAIVVGLVGSIALACNVPVYRYALDHWHPDPYRAVLFHRGALSAAEQQQFAELRSKAESGSVNLMVRAVDVDSAESGDEALLAAAGAGDLPRLVLQYPRHLQIEEPVWSGGFSADEVSRSPSLSALLDSAVRQEILQRLAAGQTSVWVMVDSGNAAQDQAVAATLENQLKKLEQTLELPKLTDSPEDAILGGPDLRIEFSVLRVARDDAAEQALLAMLLGCEPDLKELDEPIVFPIFGRSRVLLPLVGGGISPENIRNSSAFLVGACSCQVKELNPGFDLLISANWNELLDWVKSPASPSDQDPSLASTEPTLVAIPNGSTATNAKSSAAKNASVPSARPISDLSPKEPADRLAATQPASFQVSSSQRMLMVFSAIFISGIALAIYFARRQRDQNPYNAL